MRLYQSHKLPPLHLPLLPPTLLLPIPSLPRNIYDNVANDTALIASIPHLLRRPNNRDQDAGTLCVSAVVQGCTSVCKWHFSKAPDWLVCPPKSVRVNLCLHQMAASDAKLARSASGRSFQSVIEVLLSSSSLTDSLHSFPSSMSSEINGQQSFSRRSFACVFITRTNFCFRRPFHLHLVDLSGSSQLADEKEEKLFGRILEEKFPPTSFF